jgi:hypothetical protein
MYGNCLKNILTNKIYNKNKIKIIFNLIIELSKKIYEYFISSIFYKISNIL